MRRIRLLAALGLAAAGAATLLMGGTARAQEEVRLSAIEMVESKNTIDHITQTDIERKTATNLWEALKGSLGVYQQTSPSRNEGTISIRGSNRYQVGMFIDDIPIATAYRNEWDANNFMLYDLESIEVSKGYSSPLLASNNGSAGVVNLRTAKPTKEIEFSAKYLNSFDRELDDSGRLFAASVGAKRELFYLKTTVTQKQQDFFTLPSSFEASPNEDGGRRENSDSKNKALNLIAGWTPTEDTDIMFGFVRQILEKGQPFDAAHKTKNAAGADVNHENTWDKYVRWPEYETERYYLNGNVNLTDQAHLKAVLYYDGHKDTAISFNETNLSTRYYGGNYKQGGTYDQYTSGGQLTFDYTFNPANKLAVSSGYRRLSHKQYQEGYDTPPSNKPLDMEIVEDYYDFGSEYTLKPIDPLTLVFGATYTYLVPKTLMNRVRSGVRQGEWEPIFTGGEVENKGLFDYQIGAFYDLTKNHEVFATFAQKSRFATSRDRYSRISFSGTGAAGPGEAELTGTPANPDLKPEKSFNYEVGYRGLIQDWLKINSSVYYREVQDMLYSERVYSTSTRYYSRNINSTEAKFNGLELGAEALFNKYLSAGLTFNYLHWSLDTQSTTDTLLTGLPKYTSAAYAVVSPLDGLSIIPQVNYSSGFYWKQAATNSSDVEGRYNESSSFTTADLKAIYDVNEHLSFELGAKNVFDKEYAYSAYYPEPGRNFFVGMTARY